MEIKFEVRGSSVCLQSSLTHPILQAMFNKPELSDVTLFGDSFADERAALKPIKASKIVLACVSKHLNNLFTVDGFIDSHKTEYRLEVVQHEALKRIVQFIYSGKVDIPLDDAVSQTRDVLIAAKYLVIDDLEVACETYLADESNITTKNWVDVWNFACANKCLIIQNAVGAFVAKNIDTENNSDAVLKHALALLYEECSALLTNTGFINHCSVDMQCRTALAWVKHDIINREAVGDTLIDKILPHEAGKMSRDVLLEVSSSEFLSQQTKDKLYRLMHHTLKRFTQDYAVEDADSRAVKRRRCSSEKNTLYFLGGTGSGVSFYEYGVQERRWTELDDLPRKFARGGACIAGDRLIMIGGCKFGDYSAAINEYDISSDNWLPATQTLPEPRSSMAFCTDNTAQNAYIIGGYSTYKKIDKLDLNTKTVQAMPEMKIERNFSTATYTNQVIFVAGGSNSMGKSIKRIDKFDLLTSTWNAKPLAMTQSDRMAHGAALAAHDSLFLVGGTTNVVEIFNVRTGQITKAPNLTENHVGCSAFVHHNNNVVCVFGGENSKSVPCYDIREGKWSTGTIVPDMPAAVQYFGLVWR